MIDNLAKQGNLEEAKEIFSAMNEKGVKSGFFILPGASSLLSLSLFLYFFTEFQYKTLTLKYLINMDIPVELFYKLSEIFDFIQMDIHMQSWSRPCAAAVSLKKQNS